MANLNGGNGKRNFLDGKYIVYNFEVSGNGIGCESALALFRLRNGEMVEVYHPWENDEILENTGGWNNDRLMID